MCKHCGIYFCVSVFTNNSASAGSEKSEEKYEDVFQFTKNTLRGHYKRTSAAELHLGELHTLHPSATSPSQIADHNHNSEGTGREGVEPI